MISAGDWFTQGTSDRTPRQVLIARQMKCGSQVTPDSMNTNFRSGNLHEDAVRDQAEQLVLEQLVVG